MELKPEKYYPRFYLEIDDIDVSPPVLFCHGKKFIKVGTYTDNMLIAELEIPMQWGDDKFYFIAVSSSHWKTDLNMTDWPFSLAIYLPLKGIDSNSEDDFQPFAKGRAYKVLPLACLEMLGYIKKE